MEKENKRGAVSCCIVNQHGAFLCSPSTFSEDLYFSNDPEKVIFMFKSMAEFLIDSPRFVNCKVLKIDSVDQVSSSFDSWLFEVTSKEVKEEEIKSLYSFFHHYFNDTLNSLTEALSRNEKDVVAKIITNLHVVVDYYSLTQVKRLLDDIEAAGKNPLPREVFRHLEKIKTIVSLN